MHIYLDNAATTPVDPRVNDLVHKYQAEFYGNPSSPHQLGQKSKIELENVRDLVAEELHSLPKEISFSSGGTESNNLAIIGFALANREKGDHLIISGIEHPSVLSAATYLQKNGFRVTHWNPDINGHFDLSGLESIIEPQTILVSCMFVNNETGIIQPIKEIGAFCKINNINFHCDAVQAFGKFKIDVNELNIDLLTFSAHKINGPKGIGGLFIRSGIPIEARVFGGGQEANKRPGTENLIGIIGLGEALRICREEQMYDPIKNIQALFEKGLKEKVSGIKIIGEYARRSAYISAVSFPGEDNQNILLKLDMAGVFASVGSACSSGSIKQSHVLKAMGLKDEIINGTLRFSFGRFTKESDIEQAVDKIKNIFSKGN